MLKEEFEARIGNKIEQKEYAKVEQVYLNAESMDKDTFCKGWKSAKGATLELIEELSYAVDGKRIIIDKLDKRIQNLEDKLDREIEIKKLRIDELEEEIERTSLLVAERDRLSGENVQLALALIEAGLEAKAIEIIGHPAVIGLKCGAHIDLSEADKEYIAQTFGK